MLMSQLLAEGVKLPDGWSMNGLLLVLLLVVGTIVAISFWNRSSQHGQLFQNAPPSPLPPQSVPGWGQSSWAGDSYSGGRDYGSYDSYDDEDDYHSARRSQAEPDRSVPAAQDDISRSTSPAVLSVSQLDTTVVNQMLFNIQKWATSGGFPLMARFLSLAHQALVSPDRTDTAAPDDKRPCDAEKQTALSQLPSLLLQACGEAAAAGNDELADSLHTLLGKLVLSHPAKKADSEKIEIAASN